MTPPEPPLQDAEVFCQLYLNTHQAIYRYIYAMHGGPGEEVDDLAADTFLRAWRGRARFQGRQEDALRWLVGIAHNLVIDSYRRQKTRGVEEELVEDLLPSLQAGLEEALIEQERLRKLLSILQKLPEQQRELVVLHYILGWPVKQVAVHMGMLENTVSVYLKRTLERIRANWDEE
jgi:RNA polymerase sigma-70 factor (ECF subfamily)